MTLQRRHEPATLAFARFALARALRAADRDPQRARALAAEAREGMRDLPGLARRLAAVDAWLAAEGRR